MNCIPPFFIRLFVCIFAAAFSLYAYIDKQNELVQLRLAIPPLKTEVKAISEQNTQLEYEIESFESPIHLMELAKKPEFSHLKYPYLTEVITLPEPCPLEGP